MSEPEQIHHCRLVTVRPTSVGNNRKLPAGYTLAKIACRHPDEVIFLRNNLRWSHYRIEVDPATEEAAKPPPGPTAEEIAAEKAAAERARLLRKGSLADLAKVNGIGPKTAERLVDHYRVESRHALLAVLSDLPSCQTLVADRELRVSQRDLGLWRRQLQAEQVVEDDDDDEDDGADASEE